MLANVRKWEQMLKNVDKCSQMLKKMFTYANECS